MAAAFQGGADARAAASEKERRGGGVAWRRGRHGLSEGEKAPGEAAALAKEGPGRRGRDSHSGLRGDALWREVGQPDAGDPAGRGVDPALSGGAAGDGGDGGGVAVRAVGGNGSAPTRKD